MKKIEFYYKPLTKIKNITRTINHLTYKQNYKLFGRPASVNRCS